MKEVSLRKLAQKLGCSHVTVYRALSGASNINFSLRQKIAREAAKYSYSLPSHRSRNIAVVVGREMAIHGYLAILLEFLYKELKKHDFLMTVLSQDDILVAPEWMFDAVISNCWIPGFEKLFPEEHVVPMVSLNAEYNVLDNVHLVASDEENCIQMVFERLRSANCRKIMFVDPFPVPGNFASKEAVKAMEIFQIAHPEVKLISLAEKQIDIENFLKAYFEEKPDGIYVTSEKCILFYHALMHAGVRIPEDVSFIGKEDPYINGYLTPGITSVCQDFEGLARESVQIIKDLIAHKKTKLQIKLPFQLIERNSVFSQISSQEKRDFTVSNVTSTK